jgi:hypothetical protein
VTTLYNTGLPSFQGDLSSVTDGQVLQITPGVWSAGGTVTRNLYRDNVAIAGSTGATSYTYVAATDDGHTIEIRESIASGETVASPAILHYPAVTPYYAFPLNTATTTMQPLDGFGGFNIAPGVGAEAPFGVKSDGIYAVGPRVSVGHHIVDVGPHATYAIQFVLAGTSAGGDTQSAQRTVVFNYESTATFCQIIFGPYNWNVTRQVGSVSKPYLEGPHAPRVNDLLIEIRVKGNYFKLYFDGVLQESSNLNGGLGVDITGTYTSGSNHIGLVQEATPDTSGTPIAAYPFKLYKSLSVLPDAASTVNINAISVAYTNGQQVPTISGSTLGLTGNIEYLVTKLDGTVLTPWTVLGTISSNSFSATGGPIPASAGGTTVRFYARSATSPTVHASSDKALLEYQIVLPLVKGMNEGFLSGYSPSVSNRNMVQRIDWRADGFTSILPPGAPFVSGNISAASVGMGYDGIPHNMTHVGGDMRAALQDHALPGAYTVTYSVGLTVDTGLVPTSVTVTQAPANGSLKFTVDSTGKVRPMVLVITGTIPPAGAAFNITKDGDAYPALRASDQLIAWYKHAGIGCIRHMTAKMVNGDHNVRVGAGQVWKGSADAGPVTVEFEVEVANRTNSDIWYNASHLMDDGALTAEFADIEANLKPGLKCRIENSNETWNEATAFSQNIDFKIDGLKKGYDKASAPYTPFTGVLHDFETDTSTFWPDTGTSRRAVLAGERMYAPRYSLGNWVWEALQNIPANTETDGPTGTHATAPDLTYRVDPTGLDNAYWKVIAKTDAISLANKRSVADRCRHVWALADTIFANPRTRTVRVLGGWHNGGWQYSQDTMRFNNLYQVVDEWATAGYWGGGLLKYGTPSSVPGYGDAQRDLAVTDTVGFFNALFPASSIAVTQTVDLMAANKHGMARWLKSEFNLPVDTIKLCSYECGVGEGVNGPWPNKQAITTLWPQFLRDSRMHGIQQQYLTEIASKVGGVHCLFDRMGPPVPTTFDPGFFNLENWQISWGENDVGSDNPQYTGLANYPTTAPAYVVIPGDGSFASPPAPPAPPPPPPAPPQQGTGVTTIPIYGGPIKRDIIKSAYGATGQSDTEFELTAEEYTQGLRLMNMVLARWAGQWGVDLGYNFPPPGSLGSADEESGIPFAAEDVVMQALARQIAPNIGKTMGADAARNYAEAMLALRSTYAKIPPMQMQSDTPRGAGSRRCRWFGPFFSTNRPDDEIIQ